jgi:hypothetical protein
MAHSPGAIRAAVAITGYSYGSHAWCETSYGLKTCEGVADLIDCETAAQELLRSLQWILELAIGHAVDAGHDRKHVETCAWVKEAREVIAKAERRD